MVTTSTGSLKTPTGLEAVGRENVTDTGVCRWLSEAEVNEIHAAMSAVASSESDMQDEDSNEVRCRRCNMFTTSPRRMCSSCQRDLANTRTGWFAKFFQSR